MNADAYQYEEDPMEMEEWNFGTAAKDAALPALASLVATLVGGGIGLLSPGATFGLGPLSIFAGAMLPPNYSIGKAPLIAFGASSLASGIATSRASNAGVRMMELSIKDKLLDYVSGMKGILPLPQKKAPELPQGEDNLGSAVDSDYAGIMRRLEAIAQGNS